jgi:hypothetical protein
VVDDRDVSGGKELVDEFFGHLLTDQPGYSRGLQQQKDQVQEAEQAWAAEMQVREDRKAAAFPDHAHPSDVEDPALHDELSDVSYNHARALTQPWLLYANVEHDFSSLSVEETRMTSQLLQIVNLPTPDEVKEKRDEIRRAQEYLQDQIDPAEMQIGPLPPTWLGGLDGADDPKFPKPNTAKPASPKPKNPKAKAQKEVKESPPAQGSQGGWTRILACRRNEVGAAQIQSSSSSNVQSPAAQQSQISVPESALAPSLASSRSRSLTQERLAVLNDLHRRDGSASLQRRARIEAFLATSEDYLSAWIGMFTSAGDNHHGEEETEL